MSTGLAGKALSLANKLFGGVPTSGAERAALQSALAAAGVTTPDPLARAASRAGLYDTRKRASYLGAVSSGPVAMGNVNAGNLKQGRNRFPCIAMGDMFNFRGVWPNFAIRSDGQEIGTGAPLGIRVSLEYPAGVYTPVTFAGVAQGSIPDLSMILNDPIARYIPDGALYWWVIIIETTAGVPYTFATANPFLGQRGDFAGSGLADPTANSSLIPRAKVGDAMYGPIAVIGQTTRPSLLIVGDSRPGGQGDQVSGDQPTVGHSRIFSNKIAVSNMGRGGIGLSNSLLSTANRIALAEWHSDIWIELGVNDLISYSAATALANLVAYANMFPAAKPKWCSTYEPYQVTSTDAFTSLNGQTAWADDAKRKTLNTSVLGVPAPFVGCIDVCAALEAGGTNASGKWNINMTADGTHSTPLGYRIPRDLSVGELLLRS